MQIQWADIDLDSCCLDFPNVIEAHNERDGLVAIGGDLTPQRLLSAYRQGIFPWYDEDKPIMWWSFPQRMVLIPSQLKVSRSLAKSLRNKCYAVTVNYAFDRVIAACAATFRAGQNGTWLLPEMQDAYRQLHRQANACSFECWYLDEDGQVYLAGGLYGVLLGQIFYGESMFALATDASKIAFVHAVRYLQRLGVPMIDCQVYSQHLASLGAAEIAHEDFMAYLQQFNCRSLSETVTAQILVKQGVEPLSADDSL